MKVKIELGEREFKDHPELNYHEAYLVCPKCDLKLGKVSYDDEHEIDRTSILKNDRFPNYCPLCGIKLEYEKE